MRRRRDCDMLRHMLAVLSLKGTLSPYRLEICMGCCVSIFTAFICSSDKGVVACDI